MKRKIIWYNPDLKEKARQLRNNSTTSEIKLWMFLKDKQILGYDFHRQKPLDEYIVDFFCNELMLAIEIDGLSHHSSSEYDIARQIKLESLGVRFLRFEDDEVFYNVNVVLDKIEKWIIENQNDENHKE
jgi:very-short-patch-repair endonuclease